ncbi:MAG: HesA/MoeB/ThiF family protein [Myxococcota bacterium]|nr:HesA/MoeB/ThiF family protein [Myxococcota bacterium]
MSEPRYNRQIRVTGIGRTGQQRIRKGRVALVGVGALGCAIADQLVRAGIGSIRLIDPDVPELSNIQRQCLIDESDVKKNTPKVQAAADKLSRANSEVAIDPRETMLDDQNASDLLSGVDIVLDGTDNFETRYLINRTCVRAGIPWIFGGVLAMSGMSLPILPGGPCLMCALGPEPPKGSMPTTADHGILACTVATIASLEVMRALKFLVGKPVLPNLVVIDLDRESQRTILVQPDPSCPVCSPA